MDNTAIKMTESSDEQEVLVVVSKLKNYVRAKSGMNTSSTVASKITELVRGLCDQAIEKAKADGRKTLMDRDFEASTSEGSESDVLVVVSKLKNYVRARSGMNTSSTVATRITGLMQSLCDQAIEKAKADGRKTLMDRDF